MFDLNETEYIVIIDDRLYRTKEEKVRNLNMKLKLTDANGNQLDPKKRPISNATFYRILKRAKEKTNERFHRIASHFIEEQLVDFEMLEQMHSKLYKAVDIAFNEENWPIFGKLIRSWFEYLPDLTSLREACEMISKEGRYSSLPENNFPSRPFPKIRSDTQ